jgi:hypothetical protein
MPRPCRATKGLDCVSHLIYTVRPCLIHTCHAAPMSCPCHATTMLFWKRLLKSTAQRGMDGMACVNWHRPSRDGMWTTCPRSASNGYHAEFLEVCYQKHTIPSNCRTNSSDISGYHADLHEGHGTVGEWQMSGMVCVNKRGPAWARYGMCELVLNEIFARNLCG